MAGCTSLPLLLEVEGGVGARDTFCPHAVNY